MRTRFWWIAVVLALAATGRRGRAEDVDAPPIQNMKVAVWPEYDDTRVFVSYRGTLAPGAALPAQVRAIVPADADVTNTCALTPQEEHKCQLAQFASTEGGKEVRFTIPTDTFLIELYYDAHFGGPVREFAYPVLATAPVQRLEVEVQRPHRATDFRVEPGPFAAAEGSGGFQYSRRIYDNVQQGDRLVTQVRYTKQDTRPSVARRQPTESTPSSAAAVASDPTPIPMLALLAASVALVAGLAAYWFHTARRSGAPPIPGEPNGTAGRYCPMCGEPAEQNHRFCAHCGRPLAQRAGPSERLTSS
jgi:hypothetical protein